MSKFMKRKEELDTALCLAGEIIEEAVKSFYGKQNNGYTFHIQFEVYDPGYKFSVVSEINGPRTIIHPSFMTFGNWKERS